MTPPDAVRLLDLNVLIALSWAQHVHHERAHRWFGSAANQKWATTPVTETGFVRLSSTPAVVHKVLTAADAVDALRSLRKVEGHVFLPDDTSLSAPVVSLNRLGSPKQVTDLHLVNLAARHGAVLATFDRGIASFLEPADRRHVELIE